jgi:MFS transporter, DHA1 family, multidrug resistance protein
LDRAARLGPACHASGFVLGLLIACIASAQQVFGTAYGLAKLFPFAFGSVACAIALASFTNSACSGALACGGCHIVRWSRISVTAHIGVARQHDPFGWRSAAWPPASSLYGLILANFMPSPCSRLGRLPAWRIIDRQVFGGGGALFGALIARQFDGTILPLFTRLAALGFCALLSVFLVEGRAGLFRGE